MPKWVKTIIAGLLLPLCLGVTKAAGRVLRASGDADTVWVAMLAGAAYAFHVTLTCHTLRTLQSDITQQGRFFSAVIIWLGNVAVLLLGVPLVTARVGLLTAVKWCLEYTGEVLYALGRLL